MQHPTALSWFPMRATYSRELLMKDELDRLGIENFLPLQIRWVETSMGEELRAVPAVHNLIFVHSTQEKIGELRQAYMSLEPLRYMTRPSANGSGNDIIRISDAQMSAFVQVASFRQDEHVVFLDNLSFACKPGQKARITDGPYAGITGVVKRIKKNLCVVIPIERVAAVAIMHVPRAHLRYISDEEYESDLNTPQQ